MKPVVAKILILSGLTLFALLVIYRDYHEGQENRLPPLPSLVPIESPLETPLESQAASSPEPSPTLNPSETPLSFSVSTPADDDGRERDGRRERDDD